MIPKRRPRIRPVEEMEISDADIVEVKTVRPAPPVPRSGTYAAVRAPIAPPEDAIVRLSVDSISDEEAGLKDTALNDITGELARLLLENNGETVPQLRGAIDWNELSPEEAWLVSVIGAGFNLQAIIANSPRNEEDTLTLIGRLIGTRVITLQT